MSWNTEAEYKYVNCVLNLSYVKSLIDTGRVICIRIDGSRAAQLENENSDYDFTIMIDDNLSMSDKEDYLRYCILGRKTHFYLQGINWFEAQYPNPLVQYIWVTGGLLQYVNFSYNTIIYTNSVYQNHLAMIMEHKNLFVRQGIYEILKSQNYIETHYATNGALRKGVYPFFQALKEVGIPDTLLPTRNQLFKYKNFKAQGEQLKYFKTAIAFLRQNNEVRDCTKQLQEFLYGNI